MGWGGPRGCLIDLAITKLASEKNLQDVRFFGKIFGTRGDYIIVESLRWYPDKDHKNYVEQNVMPDPPRKKLPVDVQPEPMGKGVNRYSYWVCSYPNAPWTHLPDVTPQQLNAARQIKKYFTGDLNASINSYPKFPGKEINYLRAQIARIGAATQISPNGALVKHEFEEDEEEEEEEEGAPKKLREEKTRPLTDPAEEPPELEEGIKSLTNPENWVHHYQYIYLTGRATKVPEKEVDEDAEEPEEEEEEEPKKEEEEKELLEPIGKDKLYDKIIIPKPEEPTEEGEEPEEKEEEEPKEEEEEKDELEEEEEGEEEDPFKKRISPWVLKLKNALYKNHGVVMVKSLRWPGAIAYAAESGKAWGNTYMGNGLKATSRQFAPTPAPEIQKEADDIREQDDPSAMKEKLLLRGEEIPDKDSEDEADEGDEGEGEEDED
uniref:Radial spokehead-like protein n=1 Tax=Eutreptiella gymnastica TaxID=73025 RepID=A0A7S1IKD4_9EUGL|mmetsp:Transcript_24417/g.44174  ORF Transcript_24417/g.44174 Transcript_24417/m.44174 type:complete len:434 (+) Transcript_24417:2-1303(+)